MSRAVHVGRASVAGEIAHQIRMRAKRPASRATNPAWQLAEWARVMGCSADEALRRAQFAVEGIEHRPPAVYIDGHHVGFVRRTDRVRRVHRVAP